MPRPVQLRARAFGMDIEADFPLVGVEPSPHVGDGRGLGLRLADGAEVERGFGDAAARIGELRFDDGSLAVSLDASPDRGYLAYGFDFGRARVTIDGRDALIAPLDEPPWVWQRYLTGQLLPLAALLQGLEVFHAAVVGHEGKAVAVVAPSGVGKTTTALNLCLRGLDFMSDDVLVVEPEGQGLRAHPGIGLANIRPGGDALVKRLEEARLAAPVGSSERETRLAVRRSNEALPLGSVFFLSRVAEPGELRLEPFAPVDPRALIASTFNLTVLTPERLTRQLDVCARIERSTQVFRVSSGNEVEPERLAELILEHAG